MVFGSHCPICGGARGCDRSDHVCFEDYNTSVEMWKILHKAAKDQKKEAKQKPSPPVENILEDL
jgi:hypothetical protein